MGSAEGKLPQPGNNDDAARRGLEEVSMEDAEWAEVADLLQERSKPFSKRYNNALRLKRLWKVARVDRVKEDETKAEQIGKPTKLFHGTSVENALSIVKSGFKLPDQPGMFGRGVYFADCPLKSANFSKDDNTYSLWRLFQDRKSFGRKKYGQLLLCDVYLGKSKTLRRAANQFNPAEDLKPSWLFQQIRACGVARIDDYDSVSAPGGWFGAVNVPEYIVYQPHQGIPRYLMEFEYE